VRSSVFVLAALLIGAATCCAQAQQIDLSGKWSLSKPKMTRSIVSADCKASPRRLLISTCAPGRRRV